MNVKYKYRIKKAIDRFHSYTDVNDWDIVISYLVKWYYGDWFWQYEMREYEIVIHTCEHPEEGEINPFQDMCVRDLSNDMIKGLVEAEIRKERMQDGIDIISQHRMSPLRKWSAPLIEEVEINEETGLTKEREHSIMKLKEMWFDNEDNK